MEVPPLPVPNSDNTQKSDDLTLPANGKMQDVQQEGLSGVAIEIVSSVGEHSKPELSMQDPKDGDLKQVTANFGQQEGLDSKVQNIVENMSIIERRTDVLNQEGHEHDANAGANVKEHPGDPLVGDCQRETAIPDQIKNESEAVPAEGVREQQGDPEAGVSLRDTICSKHIANGSEAVPAESVKEPSSDLQAEVSLREKIIRNLVTNESEGVPSESVKEKQGDHMSGVSLKEAIGQNHITNESEAVRPESVKEQKGAPDAGVFGTETGISNFSEAVPAECVKEQPGDPESVACHSETVIPNNISNESETVPAEKVKEQQEDPGAVAPWKGTIIPTHITNESEAVPAIADNVESRETPSITDQLPYRKTRESVPDLNQPACEKQSEVVLQLEEAIMNPPKAADNVLSPDVHPEDTAKCDVEDGETKDGSKSGLTQEEIESLKGRKVSKRFGKKKYLGEVIGYDPESQWFKVLYEDGDEEELIREELNNIMLPHNSTKESGSQKRPLVTSNEADEPEGHEKKARKLTSHSTPGKVTKDSNKKDKKNQTPKSKQRSVEKKQKPTSVKDGGKMGRLTSKTHESVQDKGKQPLSVRKLTAKKVTPKKSKTISTKKLNNQVGQESGKKQLADVVEQDSGKTQHANRAKNIKHGSMKGKTSTKSKQKAKEETHDQGQIHRSVKASIKSDIMVDPMSPEKSAKLRSVDDVHLAAKDETQPESNDLKPYKKGKASNKEIKTPKSSMGEKSDKHAPKWTTEIKTTSMSHGRKRKGRADGNEEVSEVGSKQAKKGKIDVDPSVGRSTRSKLETGGTPESDIRREKENLTLSASNAKKGGRAGRGMDLIGRKMQKAFNGKKYSGEIVGYEKFYKVMYEDGDVEELTWKELEPLLMSNVEGSQNKDEEQHVGISPKDSVESKSKQKTPASNIKGQDSLLRRSSLGRSKGNALAGR